MEEQKIVHKRFVKGYWLNPRFQIPFLVFYLSPLVALIICILLLTSTQQILMAALLIFLFSIPYGIVFSHRIAGPIYRINKQLQIDAKEQTMNRVNFRKKDFFPELAGSYNVLSMALKREKRSETSEI